MNISSSVSPITASETEVRSFLARYASDNDYPFALWKLPNSPSKHLLVSYGHELLDRDAVIEQLAAGFIFAPFDRTAKNVFLPANLLFEFRDGKLAEGQDQLSRSSATWLEKAYKVSQSRFRPAAPLLVSESPDSSATFTGLVAKCLQEINNGTFEKVVPSRTMSVTLPADFDALAVFEKLSAAYPGALVSLVNIPGFGCWIGASPELLVSVENGTIFRTVALAGTQSYREGMNLRTISWTQKEIEEQALVERYVISCFKKIRLREYDEHGPRTVVAGNLIHLKSDFTVDMAATNFPQLGSIMLELLHPTSAVCGMPLEPALKFLRENEGYDRQFYAGYLGPVNVKHNTDIFVNLRCMQVDGTQAVLYAGAGVTVDSLPEEEFQETEIKFRTLLNVLS